MSDMELSKMSNSVVLYVTNNLSAIAALILVTTVSAQSQALDPVDKPAVRLAPLVVAETNAIPGQLKEDQPIGPNEQPEWTTRRRFSTTRVYVLPPSQFQFEQWWNPKWPREGKSEHLFQSELGIGLPYRFQFDIYENIEFNQEQVFQHQGVQIEARWALADWGKIPLNPTLYGEWKFNDDTPDAYELKLLLGTDLAPRWHWGLNLFYEQEVGGERGSETGFSQALGYSLIDQKLGVGVEMNLERRSSPNLEGTPAVEFLLGPSVQWRITPRTHLDLAPLFGTTHDSPAVEAFVVFGLDFGPGGNHSQILAPTSSQSR
jgi:hypothetical protein